MAPNLCLHPDLHRLFRCRVKVERWILLQSEKVIESWTNYKLVKLVSGIATNQFDELVIRPALDNFFRLEKNPSLDLNPAAKQAMKIRMQTEVRSHKLTRTGNAVSRE